MTGVYINPIKVRKIPSAAGVYESDITDRVINTFHSFKKSGLSYKNAITTTIERPKLSKASVSSYPPYEN